MEKIDKKLLEAAAAHGCEFMAIKAHCPDGMQFVRIPWANMPHFEGEVPCNDVRGFNFHSNRAGLNGKIFVPDARMLEFDAAGFIPSFCAAPAGQFVGPDGNDLTATDKPRAAAPTLKNQACPFCGADGCDGGCSE